METKYFVEYADYLFKPVLYSEKQLKEYAISLYDEYLKTGEQELLLEDYNRNDLSHTDKALDFLNRRFSDDNIPFQEVEIYKERKEKWQ